jgi:hypothetical protein
VLIWSQTTHGLKDQELAWDSVSIEGMGAVQRSGG